MYFRDRGNLRSVPSEKYTLVYPKRLGRYDRCHLHIFVLHDEPRVIIGGGELGFDGIAREADAVEIAALAERFNLPELSEVLVRTRFSSDEVNARPNNPPTQWTGSAGIISNVRKWLGRGPGR